MIRKLVGLVSLGALAACSGQDPQSAGSVAPVGSQSVASAGTFVSPTETKTYKAQGAVQSFGYTYVERVEGSLDSAGRTLLASGQTDQLYQANAATVRSPGITVSYDPRNAQFTLMIAQDNVNQNITFQDPAHRTDFGGAIQPQNGTPELATPGIKYLEVRLSNDDTVYDKATFFYEQPGTSTRYVTYAGYVRNHFASPSATLVKDFTTTQVNDLKRVTQLDRAAFVFGEQTATNAVPATGTATFNGNMIASMANNPDFENSGQSYFQWIAGTQKTIVDFGAGSVGTTLSGTVGAPLLDTQIASRAATPPAETHIVDPTTVPDSFPPPSVPIPENSTFAATAGAHIDLAGSGGFTGTFADAHFTTPGGVVQTVTIAGSSLDGAFYGPKADEVGASFRVVGGIPDQRVDVIGSFTGAKH